jgi:hypothetical protein
MEGHHQEINNAFRFTGDRLVTYDASEGESFSSADEFHIGSKIEWTRRLTLPPYPQSDDDVTGVVAELSRNGDKLSCVQNQTVPVPLLVTWLHRVVSSISIEPHKVAAMFVCDLPGKHLMELGIIDRVAPDYEMPVDQLTWTPDGHHLSFVYKNALYTVPVD